MPDNRRQAESLSLSREVSWSRAPGALGPPQHRPVLHSASGPHGGLDGGGTTTVASATLTQLQELQDKKETMDKILDELHSLRDQTLNNNYCEHWRKKIQENKCRLKLLHRRAFSFRRRVVNAAQLEHGRLFGLSVCQLLNWSRGCRILSSVAPATRRHRQLKRQTQVNIHQVSGLLSLRFPLGHRAKQKFRLYNWIIWMTLFQPEIDQHFHQNVFMPYRVFWKLYRNNFVESIWYFWWGEFFSKMTQKPNLKLSVTCHVTRCVFRINFAQYIQTKKRNFPLVNWWGGGGGALFLIYFIWLIFFLSLMHHTMKCKVWIWFLNKSN